MNLESGDLSLNVFVPFLQIAKSWLFKISFTVFTHLLVLKLCLEYLYLYHLPWALVLKQLNPTLQILYPSCQVYVTCSWLASLPLLELFDLLHHLNKLLSVLLCNWDRSCEILSVSVDDLLSSSVVSLFSRSLTESTSCKPKLNKLRKWTIIEAGFFKCAATDLASSSSSLQFNCS